MAYKIFPERRGGEGREDIPGRVHSRANLGPQKGTELEGDVPNKSQRRGSPGLQTGPGGAGRPQSMEGSGVLGIHLGEKLCQLRTQNAEKGVFLI